MVAVSHSGDTEETLSAARGGRPLGLPWVAVITGGALRRAAQENGLPYLDVPLSPQPRAAVGYLAGAVLGSSRRPG